MKVLIEKTLSQSRVVEIPDDLTPEQQEALACQEADKMVLPGDCEWCSTDFFRSRRPGEEEDSKQFGYLTVEEVPMAEWFDVG